jgi:hypothetical protein
MLSKRAIALLAVSITALPLGTLLAQSPTIAPDEVQEDWQLVVGTPDIIGVGPQITTSMSPVSDDSTPFVAFDLYYREYPNFQPGGMQLQTWSGNNVLGTSSHGSAQFQTPNETITWTQDMSVDASGNVTYRILNGKSTTWGSFGGQNKKLTVNFSTSVGSLSGYSPSTTVTNSGVSYESNYVTQLSLVQVRYYSAGRLISTDSTQRNIVAPPSGN